MHGIPLNVVGAWASVVIDTLLKKWSADAVQQLDTIFLPFFVHVYDSGGM